MLIVEAMQERPSSAKFVTMCVTCCTTPGDAATDCCVLDVPRGKVPGEGVQSAGQAKGLQGGARSFYVMWCVELHCRHCRHIHIATIVHVTRFAVQAPHHMQLQPPPIPQNLHTLCSHTAHFQLIKTGFWFRCFCKTPYLQGFTWECRVTEEGGGGTGTAHMQQRPAVAAARTHRHCPKDLSNTI